MSQRKTKNDKAWEILFAAENIVEQVRKNGLFFISSTRINEQREARLMAKFDHAVQLPNIFVKNKLSILPVSRRMYVIGHLDTYFNLPKKQSVEVIYSDLPENIRTLNVQDIYSESSAILCAFNSGMISDVVGEEVAFTILSRMSTGIFEYNIKDTVTCKSHTITVKNSQCEIDGGFEGESVLAIIEAKCESVEDFIIRQLYYPYRLWKTKTEKKVIPIFLSISNDIFTFYKFKFADSREYNSIELVSQHKYCLGAYGIEIADIRNILKDIETIEDSRNIPFPQADNFTRIIDLLGRLYNEDEPLNKDEITSIYAFNTRQTDYYVSAAIYLGFIERKKYSNKTTFFLTAKGKFVITQHPQKKNLELVKSILIHRIFNSSLRIYFDKAEIPSIAEVVSVMKDGTEKIATDSQAVRERRAQTVRAWIDWIVKLTVMYE